jgi:hypothetical protein
VFSAPDGREWLDIGGGREENFDSGPMTNCR